jgi:hypothetical protein
MYYLKGLRKERLILEDEDGQDFIIPIGPNGTWMDTEKIGTKIKLSLTLDKHGHYVLGGIFKGQVTLNHRTFYERTLMLDVEEAPLVGWLGYRVAIKIEKSL